MILLFSVLLFFANFVSFYIYNLNYIEKKLTNREKRNRCKNPFCRLLFLDSWNISNKILWIFNFFNVIISLLGIICFFINLIFKNTYFEEITGTVLIIFLLVVGFFALVSKLIINIKNNKSAFSKLVLLIILILYLAGIYVAVSNLNI